MANVKSLKDMEEENDDDKRQAYYAGGNSQNGGGSGQEILDPREFMKRARDEMGAQSVDEHNSNKPAGTSSFSGTGQSLDGQSVGQPLAPPPQEHTITFWSNGFSVDDGPLRNAQDPDNAAFLADVNQGRMPAELMGADGNPEGDVHIIDKSGEEYVPPKAKPFSGEGRTMRDESAGATAQAVGGAEIVVDEGQPTTTLQIRLADGTRKVVKANHTHTVLQLQQHVSTFCPPGTAFTLSTAFPRKKLTEMDKTLAEAGVLNETLMQT
eukprot:CAMPEP_0119069628 /NCGR_PEP_ID=MMETSP1178-20130426/24340_1 /TAXON_ID=33656 /ORGANISM="unid sp, Strain CCMP2000" /LENGTH=266 /DNA_ID=CAMNT_0007051405 /DNA_START=34 /DNA_END=834 /DNA_ORIENTATION=-